MDAVDKGAFGLLGALVLALVACVGALAVSAGVDWHRESTFLDNCQEGTVIQTQTGPQKHPQAYALCYLELIKAQKTPNLVPVQAQIPPPAPQPAPQPAPGPKAK